jgi:hypothetical protein
MASPGSLRQPDSEHQPRPTGDAARTAKPAADPIAPTHYPPLGLALDAENTSVRAQATLLKHPRLPVAQRRSLAAEIGMLHGNRHLGRVIAALTASREPAPIQAAGRTTGASVAEAARSFPSAIKFGSVMRGRGIRFNPRFWTVEYALKKGAERKTFPGWPETHAFLNSHPAWKEGRGAPTYVSIHVAIASTSRASAAIADVWKPASAPYYQFDCFVAAALIELNGIYRSYLAKGRPKADFDRDQAKFKLDLTSDVSATSLTAKALQPITAKQVPKTEFTLAEFDASPAKFKLEPGDWVYIKNPYLIGTWAGENAIYGGGKEFSGHPIGTFTPTSYADYLIDKRILWRSGNPRNPPPGMGTRDQLRRYVLKESQVGVRRRPREVERRRRRPRRRGR